ncbi:TATA box-binding protein-like protein 1 [Trichonephila inaurata madagascariensis]|uniref:TATA box-binding protein-like 1 n=1 Tax=Trichonephila inaurata madagascariensis TaxID=2747483 RepID=A0A8X6WY11_9ARAC|nr:TATA box-binding protein-like protein 1 [Trichonephila inaurata madagascariensis]
MSSYGGNGYFYGNSYLEMCLNPQNLNVVNVTNTPVIIKCEGESGVLNSSNTPIIKREETNDILKVTNAPLTKCEENNSIVNVNNAPDIKQEEVDSIEQGDPNENCSPEVDIMINNVVSSFNVRCHLNLRQIALNGANVEYRRENGMVTMKLRKPHTTASIWSSGKITCTGATSDDDAKIASRKIARKLQQLGFRVRFCNYRVVNVLCTCVMYFGINLIKFAEKHRGKASYEPELHPGATYRINELKATLKIFTTGSITVTAPSVKNAQLAIEHIFPLVEEFKTAKPPSKIKVDQPLYNAGREILGKRKRGILREDLSDEENVDSVSETPDSDESWD